MVEKICEVCGVTFSVKNYRATTARFCSQKCGGVWACKTRLNTRPNTWSAGNQHRKGMRPANGFARGHRPWNRGAKGLHFSPETEFKRGHAPTNKLAVGAVTTRTDKRGVTRAWTKVAEPNRWKLRAVVVWETTNGLVPRGMVVHHENRDALDDRPENLVLVSRAEHLNEHRPEFETRRAERATAARWGSRGGEDHRGLQSGRSL